ncbi:MAG: BREX-4 system phosphatase PglZ [Erysipelotrichaceae bacterium]
MLNGYSKEDCLIKIKDYFYNSSLHKFLFVNVNNRSDYLIIKNSIHKFVEIQQVSSYCKGEDELPKISEFMDCVFTKKDNTLILGLTDYLKLKGKIDFFEDLNRFVFEEIKGKAVFLCYQCDQYFNELSNRDSRLVRQLFLVIGEYDEAPKITFFNTSKSLLNSNMIYGFKTLLNKMEDNSIQSYLVATKFTFNNFSKSLIRIENVTSYFEYLSCFYKSVAKDLFEDYGSDEQWRWLTNLLSEENKLNSILKKELNTTSDFNNKINDWEDLNSNQRFLLFIMLKKSNNNCEYMEMVIKQTTSFIDFVKNLYNGLLNVPIDDVNFEVLYIQRKKIVKQLKTDELSHVIQYCNEASMKRKNKLHYLTDNTETEKEKIIECIVKYDYDRNELLNVLKIIYPDLAFYLSYYEYDYKLFNNYFNDYKYLKVKNYITDEFISLVNSEEIISRNYVKDIPLRSEIIETIKKDNSITFFVDAMGVEYMSYIMKKCSEMNLKMNATICRANLPTITELNKEFENEFDKVCSIKDLDTLKHKGKDDINYEKTELPNYIIDELKIIESILIKAKAELNGKVSKVIIISDHGSSRLAAINGTYLEVNNEIKGKNSGRCCLINKADTLQNCFIAEENGYYIFKNYKRFKGSRAASIEVHGGATLEEVLVPIIELTGSFEIEVKFVEDIVSYSYNECSKIVLYSTSVLKNVRLRVEKVTKNGNAYLGDYPGFVLEQEENMYCFELLDIKRSGKYIANVYEGNNIIGNNLRFEVVSRVSAISDLTLGGNF